MGTALGAAFVSDFFGHEGLVERRVHGHQVPPLLCGLAVAEALCSEFDDGVGDGFGDVAQCGGERFQYGTDVRIVGVCDGGEGGECEVLAGFGDVGDDGHVVGSGDEWVEGEGGPLGEADSDGGGGPSGGGVVLADDEEEDGQGAVSVVEVADVVGPAGGFAGVLLSLGFDGEEEGAVVLGVDAQEGVDTAFDGAVLGEVVG